MLTPKKLVQIFRRWQQAAALRRRRIMMSVATGTSFTQTVASRGHIYVYTTDHKRFMVPLKYLSSSIFQELFKMSEDEYGLPSDGPIVLPCDAACMRCIISLIQRRDPVEMDTKSVLSSISSSRCTVSSANQTQQFMLCSFWGCWFIICSFSYTFLFFLRDVICTIKCTDYEIMY